MGARVVGSIVESFRYVPDIPFGFFLLSISILKKITDNILNISGSIAFVIAIIIGAVFWGAAYIQFLIVFVAGLIIYIIIKRRSISRT
jgi:polyferredoxin